MLKKKPNKQNRQSNEPLVGKSIIVALTVAIVIVVPVSMVVIGLFRLHDCPAEPFIPIFLVVGGKNRTYKF